MKSMYVYLVEKKSDGTKFVMVGNLKNPNVGSYKYLYNLVSPDERCKRETPYGFRSNISSDNVYNTRSYRVIHCTKVS